jgi:hypothetical protein
MPLGSAVFGIIFSERARIDGGSGLNGPGGQGWTTSCGGCRPVSSGFDRLASLNAAFRRLPSVGGRRMGSRTRTRTTTRTKRIWRRRKYLIRRLTSAFVGCGRSVGRVACATPGRNERHTCFKAFLAYTGFCRRGMSFNNSSLTLRTTRVTCPP